MVARLQKARWHARSAAGADRYPAPSSRSNPDRQQHWKRGTGVGGARKCRYAAAVLGATPTHGERAVIVQPGSAGACRTGGWVTRWTGGPGANETAEGPQAFVPITLIRAVASTAKFHSAGGGVLERRLWLRDMPAGRARCGASARKDGLQSSSRKRRVIRSHQPPPFPHTHTGRCA